MTARGRRFDRMADHFLTIRPDRIQNESTVDFIEIFQTLGITSGASYGDRVAVLFRHVTATSLGLGNYLVLTAFFYILYCAFKPGNSVKNLTDVGFAHLGHSRGRRSRISRTRKHRDLGSKLPPPYPNGWFGVAESINVKIGQVISVDCFGENLAVFRASDGTVHCLDAYCPHLGANMAAGGTVTGNCIKCPFHSWRFSGVTGECVQIPGVKQVPRGINVRRWYTDEVDGMIFVWYNGFRKAAGGEEREPPPSWKVPHISEIRSGNWGFRCRNEFIVNCHIQDIPENGADVAHLNAVHGTSMLMGGHIQTSNGLVDNFLGHHFWSARWSPDDRESHMAAMHLKHDYKLFGKINLIKLNVAAKQIGPGYVRLEIKTTIGPLVILQTVVPLGPMTQKVIHRLYGPWYLAPYAAVVMWGEGIMFERDVMVWNSKRYVSNPSYVKADKTIRVYRSWYAQFYSENSLPFDEAINPIGKSSPLDW